MNMKRFFPIIVSLILLCSMLFTGCNTSGETAISTKDALSSNYNLLTDTYAESTDTLTFEEFASTVSKWANDNDITTVTVNDKYLVLSKEASGELKNVEDFTFHTALDFSNETSRDNSFQTAATVMTVLMNAENHGNIYGIFTAVKNGQPVGVNALNEEFLSQDNFIDVTYDKDTMLYNTFAASSDMLAVKDLDITSPKYSKAYKISFKGIENHSAYKERGTYPNPIKTIGDLLASCQTSTILFELASFEGGQYSDQIPGNVSATIVLHENDVESFTKKFDKSYEKIEEAYEDVDDENITFEYTMTPVDLPSEVISKEDTENIVSLMYTMINGTYLRNDNDEVEAYSNIGKVSTKEDTFKLNINAKSLNNELADEVEGVVETICGLSDINYKNTSSTKVWTNPADTPLVAQLSEKLGADPASVLEMKQIQSIIAKNSKLNLVCWATNVDDAQKDIDKVFEYMSIAGVELETEN